VNYADIEREAEQMMRTGYFKFVNAVRAVDPGAVFEDTHDATIVHVTPGREDAVAEALREALR